MFFFSALRDSIIFKSFVRYIDTLGENDKIALKEQLSNMGLSPDQIGTIIDTNISIRHTAPRTELGVAVTKRSKDLK